MMAGEMGDFSAAFSSTNSGEDFFEVQYECWYELRWKDQVPTNVMGKACYTVHSGGPCVCERGSMSSLVML